MKEEKLIEIRRELHRRAELSFEEHRTQQYIAQVVDSLGIEHHTIASTGLMAIIGDRSLPAIVLRADIDALPIEESSGVDFCSATPGVMHACGHDIHTAALLGALSQIKANAPSDRLIIAIFQPGEEVNPGGASIVLSEGVLDQFDIRVVIGQHCSPELDVGVVGYRAGQFMASTDEIHFHIRGVGGHAAQPDQLRNPVRAAIDLLTTLDTIHPTDQTPHLLTFGRIIADGATNVIPDEVIIAGTFRTFDEKWRKECKILIDKLSKEVAERHNLTIDLTIGHGYPVVYNDEKLTAEAIKIISTVARPKQIDRRLTAEDFGHYSTRYPSLFVRLGVGCPTRLHTSQFTPDERAIAIGSNSLHALACLLPIDKTDKQQSYVSH